jgi:hypothetical protein
MVGTTAALGEANKAARHDLPVWKPVSFNVGVGQPLQVLRSAITACDGVIRMEPPYQYLVKALSCGTTASQDVGQHLRGAAARNHFFSRKPEPMVAAFEDFTNLMIVESA